MPGIRSPDVLSAVQRIQALSWTSIRWSERTEQNCANEGEGSACSDDVQLQGKIHGRPHCLLPMERIYHGSVTRWKRVFVLQCDEVDKWNLSPCVEAEVFAACTTRGFLARLKSHAKYSPLYALGRHNLPTLPR